jgi:hypothetical protein
LNHTRHAPIVSGVLRADVKRNDHVADVKISKVPTAVTISII